LDEIIDFSGCERYIDTPVKRYSSGMLVRLAFAVAAHLDPEILIVDEVLAVGDAQFQKKCLGKMGEVATRGRTVLLVSHNMVAMEALCSRVLSLEDGRVLRDGNTREVVADYLSSFESRSRNGATGPGCFGRTDDQPGLIRAATVCNAQGSPVSELRVGQPSRFSIRFASRVQVRNAAVGLHVEDEQGCRVTSLHTSYHRCPPVDIQDNVTLSFECEGLMLTSGRYYLTVAVSSEGNIIDKASRCLFFDMSESDVLGTGKFPPHKDGVLVTRGEWELVGGKN